MHATYQPNKTHLSSSLFRLFLHYFKWDVSGFKAVCRTKTSNLKTPSLVLGTCDGLVFDVNRLTAREKSELVAGLAALFHS